MRRIIALVVLIAVIAGALFAPVKIPYELVSIGNITPLEEWRLVQDANGGLVATRQHFRTGMTSKIAAWQFRGGDISGMELAVRADTLGFVHRGDTILRMYSSQIQEQILELENTLKTNQAQLHNLETGEKTPAVEHAESQVAYAKEQLDLAEKEFQLKEPLYKENLISKLEYQQVQKNLDLARTAVRTASKNLEVVSTGAKSELVQVTQTEIANAVRRLAFLRQRNANYVVTAPFDAQISPVRLPGELLILQNIEHYLIQIPVKTTDLRFIGNDAKITLTDPADGKVYEASLLDRDQKSQVLGTHTVTFVLAQVATPNAEKVTQGTAAQCRIECALLSPLDYLKRLLNAPLSTQ